MVVKEDKELVQGLKKGDIRAFDSLFRKYGTNLYGFAQKYLKSDSEAEELVQEVFCTIWEKKEQIKLEYPFKSYLFKVALNKMRESFRRRKLNMNYYAQVVSEKQIEDWRTIDSIDYGSVLERLEEIIDELPERKRLIFKKSKKEGFSSKEIALHLGITVGAVDNQVSDAVRIIRQRLTSEGLIFIFFVCLVSCL